MSVQMNPSAQGVTNPTGVPGLSAPNAAMAPPGSASLSWRRAIGPPRTRVSTQDTGTLGAGQTPITGTLPGTGYLWFLDLTLTITSTGNASANSVALAEDAPFNAFASIVFDDGAAPFVNVPGFSLALLNLYGGFGLRDFRVSADTNVYNPLLAGTGAGAGSGSFTLRLPFAINDRDGIGAMGNQDRQTKYNYRDDIAAETIIYTTSPTNPPLFSVARTYGYVPVPGALSADRRPQQVVPPWYGVIHYLNSTLSDSPPVPSATVNHYLHNLNNALRVAILELRAGTGTTPRSTAESNLPTNIVFYAGADPVFSESAAERRWLMYHRYGFDVNAVAQGNFKGCLVYDAIRDFNQSAGYELGNEYIYLGDLSEAQFQIVYPAGFTAGGTLRFDTSTLAIPNGFDLTTMSHA
jgi:hypothetical protein